jgi:hypothetical protein
MFDMQTDRRGFLRAAAMAAATSLARGFGSDARPHRPAGRSGTPSGVKWDKRAVPVLRYGLSMVGVRMSDRRRDRHRCRGE